MKRRLIYTSPEFKNIGTLINFIIDRLAHEVDEKAHENFNPIFTTLQPAMNYTAEGTLENFVEAVVITNDPEFIGISNQANCSCCTVKADENVKKFSDIIGLGEYEIAFRLVEMFAVNGDKDLQEGLLKICKDVLHVPAMTSHNKEPIMRVYQIFRNLENGEVKC